MRKQYVPVLRRAVITRINRSLKPEGQRLRAVRGERARRDLGDYYVQDFQRNLGLQTHVDVEDFARELGVLKSWERLVEE